MLAAMTDPLALTLTKDTLMPVIAVGGAFLVAIVAIVADAVRKSIKAKHLEESRREIAAYVAEGSISPDDAERILKAGKSRCGG